MSNAKNMIPPDAAIVRPGKIKILSAHKIPANNEIMRAENPALIYPPAPAAKIVNIATPANPNQFCATLLLSGTGTSAPSRVYTASAPRYFPDGLTADHRIIKVWFAALLLMATDSWNTPHPVG